MKKDIEVEAKARVRVTIEIDVDGRWGGDCPAYQIHAQAADSALGFLRQLMSGRPVARNPTRFKIIGKPKVIGVFTEETD